jgi:gliding motility-associated lipoprotein GldD
MKNLIILFLTASVFLACESDYLPKPKGYNRIDLPEKNFQRLQANHPYTFEHSQHTKIEADEFNPQEENWINLNYKDMEAKVHLTYKPIHGKEENLKNYLSDAINLTSKHQVKAYGIEESVLRTPHGYTGVVAELSGEVPTQFQFFVTDSTQHFLRGALYFNLAHKNDSLAPVIEYIKLDMMHLINTLEFKD